MFSDIKRAVEASILYDRAVARRLAIERATGSPKGQAVASIFGTMADTESKKRLAALLELSKKESHALRLSQSQSQFDTRMGLAQTGMQQQAKDDRLATIAAGIGTGISGLAAAKKYRDDKALAQEYGALARRYYERAG